MRYLIFILCFLFLLPGTVCLSQTQPETWQGKINVGNARLTLVFHIEEKDSQYTGTFDSPDQGAEGLPIGKIIRNDSLLRMELENLNAVFTGKVVSDSLIAGTFTQSFFSFPLELRKKEYERKRPQTPEGPFPYASEEVSIAVPGQQVRLAGTLTLPRGEGRCPAVLLVTGSGPQNRDEEIFGHKPFLVLADYLTRHGFAVLRYDDRGVGQSTGDYAAATTRDFMNDAAAAYSYLASREETDPAKTGVLGHSEGGKIAFMLAAANPGVAFVISMAGSALRGDSVLMMQNREALSGQQAGPALTDAYCRTLRKILDAKIGSDIRSLRKDSLRYMQELFQEEAVNSNYVLKSGLMSLLFSEDPWFDFYIGYDPAEDIARVRCPVLALNGAKDVQVDADINLRLLGKILRESGNPHVRVIKYEDTNHLFQECTTGQVTEYNRIEQTLSPRVLSDIAEWLSALFE